MLKTLGDADVPARGNESNESEGHSGTSSARSAPKLLGVPKGQKRTSRLLTSTELSRSVVELFASSSKP